MARRPGCAVVDVRSQVHPPRPDAACPVRWASPHHSQADGDLQGVRRASSGSRRASSASILRRGQRIARALETRKRKGACGGTRRSRRGLLSGVRTAVGKHHGGLPAAARAGNNRLRAPLRSPGTGNYSRLGVEKRRMDGAQGELSTTRHYTPTYRAYRVRATASSVVPVTMARPSGNTTIS